jgi:hypothetical protein
MTMRRHLGWYLLAGALAVVPCAAQAKPDPDPAPCTVAPQPDPCGATPAPSGKSSPSLKFPFPGDPSASASPDSHPPSLTGVPDAPANPDIQPPAATKKFPFPGDTSPPDSSGTPGSSSSSSSSSSSDDLPPVDPDSDPASPAQTGKSGDTAPAQPGRHILHRVNPIGTKLQSADERESEDIDIAHFYMGSGDLKGAYLRGQDAVKTAPDDPNAHFLLAELALKLNKRDEAIAEYTACLKLDPIPKQARDARKALAHLKP